MDESKFSSSNSDGYVIDADFLIALTDRLVEIAERHGAFEIGVRARAKTRIGAHGSSTVEYGGTRAAIAAIVGSVDSFEFSIHGRTPVGGSSDTFMISLDLTPGSSDFLYAKGPVTMAHEAHETMRAAMAAQKEIGARLQAEAVERAAVEHPALARRIASGDRLRNGLDSLRWILPMVGYLVLLAAAVRLPKGTHAAMAFAGTFACIGVGLLLNTNVGDLRRARRARLRAEATAIGLAVPEDDHRPIRRFEFERIADTGAPRLDFSPLEPLRV
jgi:hypothetical protein